MTAITAKETRQGLRYLDANTIPLNVQSSYIWSDIAGNKKQRGVGIDAEEMKRKVIRHPPH